MLNIDANNPDAVTIFTCRERLVMARKQGRPRKSPSKLKGELLQVRLEVLEKRAFSEAAELSGQAISVWVRSQLRLAAAQKLKEAGRRSPFPGMIPVAAEYPVSLRSQ